MDTLDNINSFTINGRKTLIFRCKDLIIDKLYKLEFPSVKINV